MDASQRDALFELYRSGGTPRREIYIIGDMSLGQWADENDVGLRRVGKEHIANDSPPTSDEIIEVQPGGADTAVDGAIDEVLSRVVPSECGRMRKEREKLITVAAWPEFKIEWRKKRIKIGSARITITYPAIRVRMSKLVFYLYYALPENTARTIWWIAQTCAIRSALAGGVVGLVTANIAAAAAMFKGLFLRCMEREIVRCIQPGLMLLKEAGPWR